MSGLDVGGRVVVTAKRRPGIIQAAHFLDEVEDVDGHDCGLRDSPPLQAYRAVLEAHRVDNLAEIGSRFADGHRVRDLFHEYIVTESRPRLHSHTVALYISYMSNAMIASTGAGRLTEAWTTLRAHGIKLDGCDLPNAKILAIAAIADGKDSPAVAQASQVKAA